MPKKRTLLIYLIIILVVIAGGFFYWWQTWQPWRENVPQAEPPRLFAKEDYQIEDRPDGKYVVIDKLGFSCKVPDGWTIEIQGDDYPEPAYFLNLYSPDAKMEGILEKGCGISIMAGVAEEEAKNIREKIKQVENNIDQSTVEPSQFKVIDIDGRKALQQAEKEVPKIGGAIALGMPMENTYLLNIGTRLTINYEIRCAQAWEELIASIVIE